MKCWVGHGTLRPFSTAVRTVPFVVTRLARMSPCQRSTRNVVLRRASFKAFDEDKKRESKPSMSSFIESDAPLDISLDQDAWQEAIDQTIYVEKTEEDMSDLSSTTLLYAEPVPDSPSLSLVPTKKAVNKDQTERVFTEILAIAIPALGTVLADPLMSLVDTACVGQVSAVQLAALGPNTSIFNMIFAVLSFMGVALANNLARNSINAPGLSKEDKLRRREQNETMMSHTLVLSVMSGLVVTAALFACGASVLRFMGTSPVVMSAALDYLLVRALAIPAALFIAVSQGACLGQQDMWTPMKVMLTAGVVNLFGDILLIRYMGMGTFGAAAATSISQFAGAVFFFFYLLKKSEDSKSLRLRWKGLPTLKTLHPILTMGRILASRSFVLFSAFTGMTKVASTLGTLTLAAHQVSLQLFWFLAYFPEPLSLAAQSILARDQQNRKRVRETSVALVQVGTTMGLGLAALFGSLLMCFPKAFASDPAVVATFQRVIPHGMLTLIVATISVALDGIGIGLGDLDRLPKVIFGSTGVTMISLFATLIFQWGLVGVWTSLAMFYSTRVGIHIYFNLSNWKLSPFCGLQQTTKTEFQRGSLLVDPRG